jgi:hypothetical protein
MRLSFGQQRAFRGKTENRTGKAAQQKAVIAELGGDYDVIVPLLDSTLGASTS